MKPVNWLRESEDNYVYEIPRETEQTQFIFQEWEDVCRLGFPWLDISGDDAFFLLLTSFFTEL